MPDGTNTAPSPYLGGQPGNHAIERAFERYGVRLTQADLQAMVADCANGRAVLVRADSQKSNPVYLVRVQGVVMYVVVRDGIVVTVLPPERPRRVALVHLPDTQPPKRKGGKRYKSRRRGPAKRQGNQRWDEGD